MKIRVEAKESITLSVLLAREIAGVSREKIAGQIKRGEVKVNGVRTRENVTLKAGDTAEIFIPEKFASPELNVVYRDEFVTVVDKPPYVESEFALPAVIERETGEKVYPVHRLDTNTTGVIMFANSRSVRDALVEAFRAGEVKKTYYARVFGCPDKDRGELTAYMYKDSVKSFCTVYPTDGAGRKRIVTEYEVVERGEQSVLRLNPVTGRTHQLRAHMAYIDCPIVGDGKYGNAELNRAAGAKRQKLRSVKISLGKLSGVVSALSGKEFSVEAGEDILTGYEKNPHLN